MQVSRKWAIRACSLWPLNIAAAITFVVLKIIYPQVDWAVVVCAVLLTIVAFQLRVAKRQFLAAEAEATSVGD